MVSTQGPRIFLAFLCLTLLTATTIVGETLDITVVDARDDSPIPGAFVMVGPAYDLPFIGNIGWTQPDGTISFNHPHIDGPQTVCAGADSFAFSAVIESVEGSITMPLYRMIADTTLHGPTARVQGMVGDISTVTNDGNLDAGLILPALSIDNVIGSGSIGFGFVPDSINIPLVGWVPIPGNLVIPRQTEFLVYQKENYAIDLPDESIQELYCLGVRVPVSVLLEPLDDLNELMNSATVREIGMERGVSVYDGLELDISVDLDLTQELTVSIVGAPLGTRLTAVSLGSVPSFAADDLVIGYDAKNELSDDHTGIVLAGMNPAGDLSDVENLVAGIYADSSAYGEFSSGRLDRTPFNLPAERVLTDFYDPPSVTQDGLAFTWDDVADPGTEPDPTWSISQIRRVPVDPADTTVVQLLLWNVVAPAGSGGFRLPSLPPAAPGPDAGLVDVTETPDEDRLVFGVTISNPDGTIEEVLETPSMGATHFSSRTVELLIAPAAVDGDLTETPHLLRVGPNPAAGAIRIHLSGEFGADPEIEILDLGGRRVRRLSPGRAESILWDGKDESRRAVPAGIYLIRSRTGASLSTAKVQVVR